MYIKATVFDYTLLKKAQKGGCVKKHSYAYYMLRRNFHVCSTFP